MNHPITPAIIVASAAVALIVSSALVMRARTVTSCLPQLRSRRRDRWLRRKALSWWLYSDSHHTTDESRIMTDGGTTLNHGRNSDDDSDRSDPASGLSRDVIELIHFVTQDTRYTLLMNLLAHPKQAPSQEELVWLYPDKSRTAIVEGLDKLVEWGFVNKLVIPAGERSRSLPNTFYEMSDIGHEFLQQYRLIPDEDELQQKYQELSKPDKIQEAEEAPRDAADVNFEDVDECRVAQVRAVINASSTGWKETSSLKEKAMSVVHKIV